MEKYKIIALFGEAGAGKDYIQKKIMQTNWGQEYLHPIISYTTRPPRGNEKDGVDYHFLSNAAEFMEKDLIEYTTFRTWRYGTGRDCLDINKINIGVFNMQGIESLMFKPDMDVLPIRIKAKEVTRLMRQLQREDNPDCFEICRRFIADRQDYFVVPFHYWIIENNTYEFTPIFEEIKHLAEDKWLKQDN